MVSPMMYKGWLSNLCARALGPPCVPIPAADLGAGLAEDSVQDGEDFLGMEKKQLQFEPTEIGHFKCASAFYFFQNVKATTTRRAAPPCRPNGPKHIPS